MQAGVGVFGERGGCRYSRQRCRVNRKVSKT